MSKSRKQSSYQKMKDRYESKIAEKNREIHILLYGTFSEKEKIKMMYSIKEQLESTLWSGEYKPDIKSRLDGFFKNYMSHNNTPKRNG